MVGVFEVISNNILSLGRVNHGDGCKNMKNSLLDVKH